MPDDSTCTTVSTRTTSGSNSLVHIDSILALVRSSHHFAWRYSGRLRDVADVPRVPSVRNSGSDTASPLDHAQARSRKDPGCSNGVTGSNGLRPDQPVQSV